MSEVQGNQSEELQIHHNTVSDALPKDFICMCKEGKSFKICGPLITTYPDDSILKCWTVWTMIV
jgi:hypothetical protein